MEYGLTYIHNVVWVDPAPVVYRTLTDNNVRGEDHQMQICNHLSRFTSIRGYVYTTH